jgi:predicted O-linked N-acetylglucosamine transferase (SPINDLY family)
MNEIEQALEHHQAGRLPQAEAIYHQILARDPNHAEALHFLGVIAFQVGRSEAAIELIGRALTLKPDYAEAHNNLGLTLQVQAKLAEAVAAYQQALALTPDDGEVHNNLGTAFVGQGKTTEASAAFKRALALDPEYAQAHNNLAGALLGQGELTQATACWKRALTLEPDYVEAHSNLFQCMHYTPAFDADAIFAEARKFNVAHVKPLAARIRPHDNDRAPERRLRIGYVSGSFRQHPVGFFFLPVIVAHDKEQFEVTCYSGVRRPDAITKRFAVHADHWREITGVNDDALAAMIREDGIDILVDLAGHTAGNRLLAFARKPAPVQVTGGGHYDTTGLDVIDYLLSDRFHTPAGSDRYFSEELVRLPNGYVCYGPPDYAPPVTESPVLHRGYITFGCFNNLAKITPQVIELWAEIHRDLPDARMKLQTRELCDAPTREHYRAQFESHGIHGERLELESHVPHRTLLANYSTIDIALDPFPYSGGLTTCEALWMGVPVITLTGNTFAGRHSTSHLSNVGLTRFVTTTPEEYVAVVKDLARDVDRLAEVRRDLRNQMASSPLCDKERYTRDLEAAYRRMWRVWCQKPKASGKLQDASN